MTGGFPKTRRQDSKTRCHSERSEESQEDALQLIDVQGFAHLFSELVGVGFTVYAPCYEDGAMTYQRLTSFDGLPRGYYDDQEAGHYRLRNENDGSFFRFTVGPQSLKRILYPMKRRLWSAKRDNQGLYFHDDQLPTDQKIALIGVRACDLQALSVLDKVYDSKHHPDPHYSKLRENIFIISTGCTRSAATCFCTSMGEGPNPSSGFDLNLIELLDAGAHRFLVTTGSSRGKDLLTRINPSPARKSDSDQAAKLIEDSAKSQIRTIPTHNVVSALRDLEHPHWDQVARRCLSCANCTLVCPTCFCSTTEDVSDLSGEHVERWLKWDSCFTLDFTHLTGGSVRKTIRSRYRQWLTHKLSTWHDQFGVSGCVGCGRCISWCPVGIDLTEEVKSLGAR